MDKWKGIQSAVAIHSIYKGHLHSLGAYIRDILPLTSLLSLILKNKPLIEKWNSNSPLSQSI